MILQRLGWCVLLVMLLPLQLPAQRVLAAETEAVQAHIARARGIAGDDLGWLADGYLCRSPAALQTYLATIPGFLDPQAPAIKPFRAFDNLYYVGLHWVGSWILDTGAGLILFDALTRARDVRDVLLPGMRLLGLDPGDIRIVVISHAHFDHYGGARYLQKHFNARIAASAVDWQLLARDDANTIPVGYHPVERPDRDMVLADGETLTLGDSTLQFLLTPGHTPGTVSTLLPVRDGFETRYMALWGGTALPRNSRGLGLMHDSLHKFWDAARELHVTGLLNNHPWAAGNLRQGVGDSANPNPLVLGAAGFERAMSVQDECLAAQLARLDMGGR